MGGESEGQSGQAEHEDGRKEALGDGLLDYRLTSRFEAVRTVAWVELSALLVRLLLSDQVEHHARQRLGSGVTGELLQPLSGLFVTLKVTSVSDNENSGHVRGDSEHDPPVTVADRDLAPSAKAFA